ncbi:3-hydroxyacyl-CoA dehydrogenase NAD-binding domain-containing protein [Rhizorhabdus dicambivorans]|uniref:3-hydroxyacyl-CoA dehydrogenase n=1 Tax=Rhizorhabdus dicambivorans TaxID=1850238 RepID=A0A2A4FP21_9SPHN|nr:3-hydroxyacyl-CoA dehydrogenase NAD-binding domain-containing protein [Rhizorhabdus dicambivorans]ATE66314.1 3-hydroxyacyl-CoA dehydrogenase [Rhizorhabdus dicambivorans]PCE40153.1 3-hydroxyacyl-CoA dehydrogenase [Rhizorhabdus dicambivorans]
MAAAGSLVTDAVVSSALEGRIAVVTVNYPPVNALGAAVRQGVSLAITQAEQDAAVGAIVLVCEGRTFFAGADITEFGKRMIEPSLRAMLAQIENATKPVIAAIHGTALGGGLETALVAHYRVGVPSARVGLPEVNLGLLPGAGGTQRLPRVIGVEKALDLMTSGALLAAGPALTMGLFDELVEEGELRKGAINFANKVLDERRPLVKVRHRSGKLDEARANPKLFTDFRKANAKRFRGFKAPENIIRSVEGALQLSFDEGMARERELFDELLQDSQSAAMRHVFFAERQAAKIDDVEPDTPTLPIAKVGVIGAGTMGSGIVMNFLNAGIPSVIVETKQEALDRGLGLIRKNYENTAAKGKMKAEYIEIRMGLLTPSLALEDLADCDLIIEAVFENINVKKEVFAKLDKIAKPGAILATNTSYLDVEVIAAATSRPASVIGLHFFSPANIMKLLEIVRTNYTALPIVATAAKLAKTIGKVGVTVGNGFGFVGNRILAARDREVNKLLLEGATPSEIDRVLYEFGFPMGHLQMRDLVGLDVGWDRETSASSTVREILNEMGRHGQKSGGGYYDYDEQRNPTPSPIAAKVIADFAANQGVAQRNVSEDEVRDRVLYAMVNEGARILDDKIAVRASDIDIVWITGYGWPRYRGGPMFWADLEGLPKILARLKELEAAHGADFTPSPLIERLVSEGRGFVERQ